MKVYIGPYSHWFCPATWYKNWVLRQNGFYSGKNADKFNVDDYDKLVDKIRDSWIYAKFLVPIERWVENNTERTVQVKIHSYDVWSMDSTLGDIILPMLKLLREKKQGYPYVDDGDVPEHLRSTAAPPLTQKQIDTGWPDNNCGARWDWVMNEMIWAFEQQDPDADDHFFVGQFDKDGYNAWQERKTRGFALFGKYFEALWD